MMISTSISRQDSIKICLLLLVCSTQLASSRDVQQKLAISENVTRDKNSQILNLIKSPNATGLWSGYRSVIRHARVPKLQLSKDIFSTEQMKDCEHYFFNRGKIDNVYKVSEFGMMALSAKFHSSVYSDLLLHKYEDFNDLKDSVDPAYIDQEKCLRQLNYLTQKAGNQSMGYRSKDVNFHLLIDTFGHKSSGLYAGDATWLGAHDECLRMEILTDEGKSPTRYCLASLSFRDWPQYLPFSDIAIIKAAVCIPRVCDSLKYKNKHELILKLLEFNAREFEKGQIIMRDVFCLPDETSPLRSVWRSPATAVFVILLTGWICLLIYCTFKHEQLKRHTSTGETNEGGEKVILSEQDDKYLNVYRSLSIVNNLSLLFDTSKASSMLDTGDKIKSNKKPAEQNGDTATDTKEQPVAAETEPIVDLRCIEGVKVISMAYVIMGHVLMCVTVALRNGGEMGSTSSPAFYVANLVPAFAVNAFFTITGILTAYLMFKQNQSFFFMTSPTKWVAFIMYRYMRIMPMYLIVVAYTKYLARYMSSGPLWDYGTSGLSQRRICEQESWWHTILFIANFKPPLDHCIPSAWYLANDFQFFIVTPIFLFLLNKNANLGRLTLKLCIAAGYIAGFISIFMSDMEDLTPIARFMPHGFKTYTTHLSHNYTRPQYRIPAYLIGLLIGHSMHQFEQRKLKHLAAKKQRESEDENHNEVEDKQQPSEYNWSDDFIKYGVYNCIFFVSICCLTPVIGSYLPFNKLMARLAVAIIMPSYHVFFSVAIGLYLLLATTGYGNPKIRAFLGAPAWKPFARLSLCAVLVNVEVINYLLQSKKQPVYLDNPTQISLNLLCIVSTYLAAIVLCVLFEAPVRAALNHLLSFAIKQMAGPSKQKSS